MLLKAIEQDAVTLERDMKIVKPPSSTFGYGHLYERKFQYDFRGEQGEVTILSTYIPSRSTAQTAMYRAYQAREAIEEGDVLYFFPHVLYAKRQHPNWGTFWVRLTPR